MKKETTELSNNESTTIVCKKISLARRIKMRRIEAAKLLILTDFVDTVQVKYIDRLVDVVINRGGNILDDESYGSVKIDDVDVVHTLDTYSIVLLNKVMIKRWGLKILKSKTGDQYQLSKCCIRDGDYDSRDNLIIYKSESHYIREDNAE